MRIMERRAIGHRPTVAVVDLGAIRHNVRAVRPRGAQVMAVVKANGYGHGAVPVARAALQAGATWLGVALVEEGLELREAGIGEPVFVLSEFPAGAEEDAVAAGLTPSVYTSAALGRLAAASARLRTPVGVHLKVDTGMHRVGVDPDDALVFAAGIARSGLRLDGVWTHFAKADDPGDPYTALQLGRFARTLAALGEAGFRPPHVHAANSAAVLGHPEAHFNLVRLGAAMYGLAPGPNVPGTEALRPAMSWRSEVTMAKRVRSGEGVSYGLRYRLEGDATIATVPVGYADGYRRRLSEGGSVLIGGRRRPVAGLISMDQTTVDCGDEPVRAGDEVVLIGRQGDEEITAGELAGRLGTIGYEIVCGVAARVPRRYVG